MVTASDIFVAAAIIFWAALNLMHRSEKRHVHEPCTRQKTEQPYPLGTYAERETGLAFTGTKPVGLLAHRDQYGGMSVEVPGHECKNCEPLMADTLRRMPVGSRLRIGTLVHEEK